MTTAMSNTNNTTAARRMTMAQAIAEAIAQEMQQDPEVFVLGEDVGKYGGIFGATTGLLAKFGKDRIMDTPISELVWYKWPCAVCRRSPT
eukprot:gene40861-50559_t